MFVTAQRVRSKDSPPRDGINTFLYLHGRPLTKLPDPKDYGTNVDMRIEVEMGGNAVLSYLDVVTFDDPPQIQALEDDLRNLFFETSRTPIPWSRETPRSRFTFNCTGGTRQAILTELASLWKHVQKILADYKGRV